MSLISTKLFLLATTLVLLYSFHTPLAQARVQRELFAVDLLASIDFAKLGEKMAYKGGEVAMGKFVGPEARKGFKAGEKVINYYHKMVEKADEVCTNAFCIYGSSCLPCNGAQSQGYCARYCAIKVEGPTYSCILPCGPAVETNSPVADIYAARTDPVQAQPTQP